MESFVRLNRPRKDGTTLKGHYEQAWKTSGKRPAGLTDTSPPPDLDYLWEWFWELDHSRDRSMSISPITYAELHYWQRIKGVTLKPWELDAIRMMDTAYCSEANKKDD